MTQFLLSMSINFHPKFNLAEKPVKTRD